MRIPLLVLAVLVAAPGFAQIDNPPYGETTNPIKGPQLASPSAPSPGFPLRVWLRLRRNTWEGSYEYYAGEGRFEIASPTPAKPINFQYQCGVTFLNPATNQFEARWIKPGKTLQIALADPDRPQETPHLQPERTRSTSATRTWFRASVRQCRATIQHLQWRSTQ